VAVRPERAYHQSREAAQCLVLKLENGLSHPAPEGRADIAAEGRELIGTFCVFRRCDTQFLARNRLCKWTM
jgi:hypothetical protein